MADEWRPHEFDGDVDIIWSTRTAVDLPAAWKAWVKGNIRVRRVEGHHLRLLEEPMVTAVGLAIAELLDTDRLTNPTESAP